MILIDQQPAAREAFTAPTFSYGLRPSNEIPLSDAVDGDESQRRKKTMSISAALLARGHELNRRL